MNDRPHDDALLALLYDELPPAEAEALREKLAAEDPEGLERLAQWQAIRSVVAELPELEPDPQIHYDIIREARRAVDSDAEPAGIWAWLQSLMLTPAFAGLLLVVLAAGLTVRLTTDLEEADDSALAPQMASDEPVEKKPLQKAGAPAKAADEKSAGGETTTAIEGIPPVDSPPAEPATAAPEGGAPGYAADLDRRAADAPARADGDADDGKARAGLDGIEASGEKADGAALAAKAGAKVEEAAALERDANRAAPPPKVTTEAKDARRQAEEQSKSAPVEAKKGKSKAPPSKLRAKKPARKGPPARRSRRESAQGKAEIDDLLGGIGDARPEPEAPAAPPPPAPQATPQATATRRPAEAPAEAVVAETEERERAPIARADKAADDTADELTNAPMGDVALDVAAAAEPTPADDAPTQRAYAPPPPAAEDAEALEEDAAAVQVGEVAARSATGGDAARDANQGAGVSTRGATAGGDGDADRLGRARTLRARGLHQEAISEYEAFLAETEDQSGLDRVWFETAESYRAIGQDQRALRLYRLVAGGDSSYADRARARIATMTGQNTGASKKAGQAAPARARPAAAPDEAEVIELRE